MKNQYDLMNEVTEALRKVRCEIHITQNIIFTVAPSHLAR